MGIRSLALGGIAVAALVCVALVADDDAAMPRPVHDGPGEEDSGFRERRAAWIESLHRRAPGVDWHSVDAAYRQARFERQQTAIRRHFAAGKSAESLKIVSAAGLSGRWIERGANDVAGRVAGTLYDTASGQLTISTAGGQIWRARRDELSWRTPNDGARFTLNGFQGGLLERIVIPGGNRLLVASPAPFGLFRSDDDGLTWTAAAGLDVRPDPFMARSLAIRGDGAEIYALFTYNDPDPERVYSTHLFVSTDRGASFRDLGRVGGRARLALFAPRYDSNDVYLLTEQRVRRIAAGTQELVDVGTVPTDPERLGFSLAVLSGGVAADGRVFLYAFYSDAGNERTEVLRSLDGGTTWEYRGRAPTPTHAAFRSAESSTRDPSVAFVGGINAYRTVDGGTTWQQMSRWEEYYDQPATRLHADIMNYDVYRDAGGVERVFVSTDGGLYESTDDLETVRNLTLEGLRDAQYYSSYSQPAPPYRVFVGSQDQGYQKAVTTTGGIERFDQVLSGDYGHLGSGDAGRTLWSVYPDFALYDSDTASADAGLRFFDFDDNGFTGYTFMTPLAVDPHVPTRAYLAGGTLGSGGHHVIRLEHARSGIFAVEEPRDFGATITALTVGTDGSRYAITDDGRFHADRGTGWTDTPAGAPPPHYFYGNHVLVDTQDDSRIYIAGAGYSNPPVYRSDDGGATFRPFATGLPGTLVFDLAMSQDGRHLFAATEVGPFYYDTVDARWIDLTGLGAPNQTYWSVEFVEGERRARFATYGRGIWDFALADGPPTLNQHGLTGLWFEPATAGQGFALEFLPDLEGAGRGLVAGGWFTFDVADGQRWYAVSGPALADATSTTLTIFRNVGGNFAAPPVTTAQPFGTATFAVSSCTRGTFDYSLDDGRSGSIALERLTPSVGCGESASTDDAADFAFSGNWFDPATSGQGFVFEANPKLLPLFVFAWYTYAPNGATLGAAGQRWFTGQAGYTRGARTLSMPIFETRGGRFDAPTPVPTTSRVGNATVALTSCTTARVDYAFDGGENAGRSGSISLQRAGPAPAGCRP